MTTEARYSKAHLADDGTRISDTERDDPRGAYAPTIAHHGHAKTPDGRLSPASRYGAWLSSRSDCLQSR